MSDLLSMGASAVKVYQRALGTVSNNIANMDSDGYTRRLSKIEETAPRMVAGVPIGTGAMFEGVERAYDSFLESSVRDAAAELGEKSKFVIYTNRLLDLLGNDEATLMAAMDDFFSSAKGVANDSASLIKRSEFLAEAETLVSRFNEISSQIDMIETEALADLDALVTDVNGYVEQLGVVNKLLQKKSAVSKQSPDLLDQRDAILRELSSLIPIKVAFDNRGVVSVSATNSMSAGLIVDTDQPYQVKVGQNSSGETILLIDPFGKAEQIPIVETGEVGGVISWQTQILEEAYDGLDSLALLIADSVNSVHGEGLDLFGEMGGPLFRVDPVFRVNDAAVTSPISIQVEVQDEGAFELNQVLVEYVSTELGTRWRGTDQVTNEQFFSDESGQLVMKGVGVLVTGQPNLGETFTLEPANNPAAGIKLAIDDPRRVASASLFRIISSPSNLSTAEVVLDYDVQTLASSDLNALRDQFGGSGGDQEFTSVTASFYEPVGYLSAGLKDVAISNAVDTTYPSSVQVFTRDGRQLLGQALTDEAASTLIREESGFVQGATYSDAYLNHTAESSYRDINAFYGYRAEASSETYQSYETNERTGEKTLIEFDRVNPARITTGPIEPITNSTGDDLDVISAAEISLQGFDLPALTLADGETLDAALVSTWINDHAITNGLALTARISDQIEVPTANLKLTGARGPGLSINDTSINSGQGFTTTSELIDAINAETTTTGVTAFVDTRGVLILTNNSAARGANIDIGLGSSVYGNALAVRNGTHSARIVIEETGFHNGDLSEGDSGDTVIAGFSTTTSRVTFGTTLLGGLSTPIDETYTSDNLALGLRDSDTLDTDGAMTVALASGSVDGTDGNVIKLQSAGLVSSNENAVIRGPALETNAAVALRAGDQVQFNWKAEEGDTDVGEDTYDVFAYLLNVNTGEKQVVLDQTGSLGATSTNWETVTATVETAGEYKVVFISGAYDLTGGLQGFENANFDEDAAGSATITGWTIVNDQIILGSDIGGVVGSPVDATYETDNGGLADTDTPTDASYSAVVDAEDSVEASGTSVALSSSGNASTPNAVIRGPAIYNDATIELAEADVVSIDYTATSDTDSADIFVYLINEDTGETAELVNVTGDSAGWATASSAVPSAGNYRLVIAGGSYDSDGNLSFGSTLSVDNIQVERNTPYANPDRLLGSTVYFDNLSVIPDTTQVSEVNKDFTIELGINPSAASEDFRVLGLQAKSYIDGTIDEDLLVFITPDGGLGQSGQSQINLAYDVDDSFVPQRALREAQFDIMMVQDASTGKQEQRSFVISGVEVGSVLSLQVTGTTDPIEYTVIDADVGDNDEETLLNALNNFVATINQSSAMDRPDSQGGRIVASADTEALALMLTSTTATRTQMQIEALEVRGIGSFTTVTEDTIADGSAVGTIQRGEEASEFGIYQILDRTTGTILADRHWTESDEVSYRGVSVSFTERPLEGDVYRVDGNNLGPDGEFDADGNNLNMIRLVRLESDTTLTGTGETLGETYIGIVSDLGNRSVQATVSRDAMQAVFDQAVDARDAVSGVSLDQEAADLIRFQQAYQSSAQIMQTSVKLFESILGIR